jgi:hypothetical protein
MLMYMSSPGLSRSLSPYEFIRCLLFGLNVTAFDSAHCISLVFFLSNRLMKAVLFDVSVINLVVWEALVGVNAGMRLSRLYIYA